MSLCLRVNETVRSQDTQLGLCRIPSAGTRCSKAFALISYRARRGTFSGTQHPARLDINLYAYVNGFIARNSCELQKLTAAFNMARSGELVKKSPKLSLATYLADLTFQLSIRKWAINSDSDALNLRQSVFWFFE